MTPIIYMECTLNLMLKNGIRREVDMIVATGEHRVSESKSGKYIIIRR
jgi:hypothetical protein